jgi:hypothetical protein
MKMSRAIGDLASGRGKLVAFELGCGGEAPH